jgi:hypothetical protein
VYPELGAGYRSQACINSNKIAEPMTETTIEPKQPRRFEKNANMDDPTMCGEYLTRISATAKSGPENSQRLIRPCQLTVDAGAASVALEPHLTLSAPPVAWSGSYEQFG